METHQLPPELERIAQKAEACAAEFARGLVILAYELAREVVEEIRTLSQPSAHSESKPSASHQSAQGQFLSVEEAAEFLRLKPSTLYSWVSNDKIPYSKVGSRILFEREALVEFVKTRKGKRRRDNNAQVSTPGKPREKDSQTPIRMVK